MYLLKCTAWLDVKRPGFRTGGERGVVKYSSGQSPKKGTSSDGQIKASRNRLVHSFSVYLGSNPRLTKMVTDGRTDVRMDGQTDLTLH